MLLSGVLFFIDLNKNFLFPNLKASKNKKSLFFINEKFLKLFFSLSDKEFHRLKLISAIRMKQIRLLKSKIVNSEPLKEFFLISKKIAKRKNNPPFSKSFGLPNSIAIDGTKR